ncbi:cytochrome b [Chelatococcus sp. GCM10030263]|uniref:cytochrome b n=1 Tax=Chelatococcus sp. GCM10030263 TaxID=3273387 RepID=UPI003607669C
MTALDQAGPRRGKMMRWSPAGRLLHWGMAVLIIGLVVVGLVMTRGRFDLGTTFALYQSHKSYGLLVLPLLAWRLLWRWRTIAPPAPPTMAAIERRLARAAHVLFYLMMAALPLSGWIMASASPLRLPTRPFNAFTLPDLVQPDPALFEKLRLLHEVIAYGLVALLVLHVAAALKHHILDKDDILSRMGF